MCVDETLLSIQGIVLSEQTGVGIEDVWVETIPPSDRTATDAEGRFRIESGVRADALAGPAVVPGVRLSGEPVGGLDAETLRDTAKQRGTSLNRLVAEIDRDRDGSLSSAIRIFALAQARATS